jgi:pimeloyl-[acyl-carrier protein] synthase
MTDVATVFDIFDPANKADPYPMFRRMRAEYPVHVDQHAPICWLFRFADCEEALRDPRLGSPLGSPEVLARKLGDGAAACYIGTSMLAQDPPQHTRLRRAVSKAFTAKAVERMRATVVDKVNGLLDEVTAGGRKEFDLANEVAYRIPIGVVCGMLGVPAEHHDRFRSLIEENAAVVEPMPTPEQVAMADKASGELMDLVTGLAAERRVSPRDDLLSVLVAHQDDDGGLSDRELVANVSLLIAAGFCSTMQLIGNTVYTLLRHPDQLDLVRGAPELAAAAVEETLRYEPPVMSWPRSVLEPVSFGGADIPVGSVVISVIGSANRDETVFGRPDEFDITRPSPRHLTFGGAVHHCLGAPLARMEAELAVQTIVTRFPDLRLATDDVEWLDNFNVRGLKELPVST